MKEKFNSLLENKPRLLLVIINMSLGFLFFIGTYFTFMKSSQLIGGKLSISQLPGGFIFILVILVTTIAYAYGMLMDKEVLPKRMLLIQSIFATLFHLYGALVFRVGSEGAATGGFGRIFLFLILVLMWVNYVKPKIVPSLIGRFLPNHQEEIQELA